jgi:outer membrane lipoprotein SlyB
MTTRLKLLSAALVGAALAIGGCATPYGGYYGSPAPAYAPRVQYGVIENIEVFRTDGSGPVGVGALIGGIAGGVIGHQIGSGSGNTAATIAGALGGAVVGNQVEQQNRVEGSRYRLTVRLDGGGIVYLDNANDLNLRVGDRVRVEGNRVYRM